MSSEESNYGRKATTTTPTNTKEVPPDDEILKLNGNSLSNRRDNKHTIEIAIEVKNYTNYHGENWERESKQFRYNDQTREKGEIQLISILIIV